MRRWSDDTGLLAIDRDNEHWNSVRAAEAGVGAPVVAYLPEHNAMVFEFLEGRTMSPEDLRSGDHTARVADACRQLHTARRFRDDFDMFETQPRYLGIVQERGFRLPDRYLEFAPHVAAIRDAFAVRAEPTVPCNNDLLAENFILGAGRLPADRLRVLGQQRRLLRARERVERVQPLARAARGARRRLLRAARCGTRSRAPGCGA